MIDEEATFEAFGHYSSTLTQHSGKLVIAICELCGKIRMPTKDSYHTFCHSCSPKLSGVQKGARNPGYKNGSVWHICLWCGKNFKISASRTKYGRAKYCSSRCQYKAQSGRGNYNYKGGIKVAQARMDAKRKKLGFELLMPLKPGEVGHHLTDKYVIGIPRKVHEQLSGSGRKKHRALVLEWLKDNDIKKFEIVLNVLGE